MPTPQEALSRLLNYLEERIDLDHVREVAARHRAALRYEPVDRLPLVCYLPYEGSEVAPYPYPEAFTDPAKMMVNELLVGFTSIYHAVTLHDDAPYCLRPNLGVTIIASMFGAQVRLIEGQMPWVEPLAGGHKAIRRLVQEPLPDLGSGLLPRVLEHYAFFREALQGYPSCQAAIQLTLPDLQGPLDVAHLLWGSGLYLAMYDDPDLVEALLAKVATLIAIVARRLQREVRDSLLPEGQHQFGVGVLGALMVRNDSAVNISASQYKALVRPWDTYLAEELGSIGIHFCGRGHHQVEGMLAIPSMRCFDVGQPEMMDLDRLYAQAAARRVALTRLRVPENELQAGAVRHRFPTGVNLVYQAASVAQARQVWRRYIGQVEGG